MVEDAGAADLISGGRLQLGVSRGSPETALNGSHSFGYVPADGETDADLAREHTEIFRAANEGRESPCRTHRWPGSVARSRSSRAPPG